MLFFLSASFLSTVVFRPVSLDNLSISTSTNGSIMFCMISHFDEYCNSLIVVIIVRGHYRVILLTHRTLQSP
jgi:uncharacterized membrane protein